MTSAIDVSAEDKSETSLMNPATPTFVFVLAAVPGVLCARRFRAASTTLQKYVALYHLSAPEVCSSQAWRKAVETPWTEKVRPYMRDRLRIVCKAYGRAS